jgi:hypothetical protein
MSISPFFHELRSAYQAEIDDMTFDSDGRDVLRQRLAERRKELGFLLSMLDLSPEMVAVVFHQGFQFKSPAAMEHLLTQESDEFPGWDVLADALVLTPWAQALADVIVKEPTGEWFMSVAAGLEYMYSRPDKTRAASGDTHSDDKDEDEAAHDERNAYNADEDGDEDDARAREEAGADWMVEQGFDRKD